MPRRKLEDYSDDVLDSSFDGEEDYDQDEDYDFEEDDDDLFNLDSTEGEYVQDDKINMRKGYYPYYPNNSDRYDDEY